MFLGAIWYLKKMRYKNFSTRSYFAIRYLERNWLAVQEKKLCKDLIIFKNYSNNNSRTMIFYVAKEWTNKRYLNSIRNNAIFRLLLVEHQHRVNKFYYFLFSISQRFAPFYTYSQSLKRHLKEFQYLSQKQNLRLFLQNYI